MARLGADIDPGEILAVKGDAGRGEKIFFREAGNNCASCHQVEGKGRDYGPDLSRIAERTEESDIIRLVAERLDDGVFLTTPEARVIFGNRAAGRLLGRDGEPAGGRSPPSPRRRGP